MKALLMLGALLGTLPAASSARDAQVVPLAIHNVKQFTLEAEVAGKPRRFLFDTGEGITMISPALAKEIGCEPWGNVTAIRMTGDRLDLQRCDDVRFGIGSASFVAPSVIVYDLGEIAGKNEARLDGSIGLDIFAGRTITIDLAERRVIVETPASVKRRLVGAVEVPLRLVTGDSGGLDVNLGVKTPRGLAWMELDTGNAGPTIFVSEWMAPLFGLDPTTRQPQDVTVRLASVDLQTRARVFPKMIMDGNIGMQLVRDRVITLDLKSGRAWLAPVKASKS